MRAASQGVTYLRLTTLGYSRWLPRARKFSDSLLFASKQFLILYARVQAL